MKLQLHKNEARGEEATQETNSYNLREAIVRHGHEFEWHRISVVLVLPRYSQIGSLAPT